MKNAERTPDRINPETPRDDSTIDESCELKDTDLDSVAGGITWHLPDEPVKTPWDDVGGH